MIFASATEHAGSLADNPCAVTPMGSDARELSWLYLLISTVPKLESFRKIGRGHPTRAHL